MISQQSLVLLWIATSSNLWVLGSEAIFSVATAPVNKIQSEIHTQKPLNNLSTISIYNSYNKIYMTYKRDLYFSLKQKRFIFLSAQKFLSERESSNNVISKRLYSTCCLHFTNVLNLDTTFELPKRPWVGSIITILSLMIACLPHS